MTSSMFAKLQQALESQGFERDTAYSDGILMVTKRHQVLVELDKEPGAIFVVASAIGEDWLMHDHLEVVRSLVSGGDPIIFVDNLLKSRLFKEVV